MCRSLAVGALPKSCRRRIRTTKMGSSRRAPAVPGLPSGESPNSRTARSTTITPGGTRQFRPGRETRVSSEAASTRTSSTWMTAWSAATPSPRPEFREVESFRSVAPRRRGRCRRSVAPQSRATASMGSSPMAAVSIPTVAALAKPRPWPWRTLPLRGISSRRCPACHRSCTRSDTGGAVGSTYPTVRWKSTAARSSKTRSRERPAPTTSANRIWLAAWWRRSATRMPWKTCSSATR